jgi:hypothetical protein
MNRLLRLGTGAVLTVLAVRVLDWLLSPVLPLLVTLLVLGGIGYVVLFGRRGS